MSVKSEESSKAFKMWKKELDERAEQWVKEHPESQEPSPLPEKESKES
jgi:molybdopterin synthase catalytic subunit